MPRVTIYLPDDLDAAVRAAKVPMSATCQAALLLELGKVRRMEAESFNPEEVAERLVRHEQEEFQEGRTLGLRWAANVASYEELESLAGHYGSEWGSLGFEDDETLPEFLKHQKHEDIAEEFEQTPFTEGIIAGAAEVLRAVAPLVKSRRQALQMEVDKRVKGEPVE
jgi:post-segregation antitoxin (ccd killing protein)